MLKFKLVNRDNKVMFHIKEKIPLIPSSYSKTLVNTDVKVFIDSKKGDMVFTFSRNDWKESFVIPNEEGDSISAKERSKIIIKKIMMLDEGYKIAIDEEKNTIENEFKSYVENIKERINEKNRQKIIDKQKAAIDAASKNKSVNDQNPYNAYNTKKNKASGSNEEDTSNLYTSDYNMLPIELIIMSLAELNYIKISKISKSGKENKFYFTISDEQKNRLISDYFVISTIAINNINEKTQQKKIFSFHDFREHIKSGNGAVNFLKRLEEKGCFGVPEEDNNDAVVENVFSQIVSASKYGDIEQMIEHYKAIYTNLANTRNLSFTERVPLNIGKKSKEWFDYLKNIRKLNHKIVMDAFNQNAFFINNMSSVYNRFSKDNLLFNLRYPSDPNISKDICRQVEYCYLDKKTGKLVKKHMMTRNKSGMGFVLDSNSDLEQKGVVLAEASIDTLSIKNLFMESSLVNEEEYKYIGLSSCNNFSSFIEKHLGIVTIKEDKKDAQPTYNFMYKSELKIDSEELVATDYEVLSESHKGDIFNYIDDGSEQSRKSLLILRQFLKNINLEGNLKIIEKSKINDYINMREYAFNEDSEFKDYFFDYTNVIPMFKGNNIYHKINNGEVKFYKISEKFKLVDISKDNRFRDEIVQSVRKNIGNGKIILFFDNDAAGMAYCERFDKLFSLLDIDHSIIITPHLINENETINEENYNESLNDANDAIKKYYELLAKKEYEKARNFVDAQIVSQINSNVFTTGIYNKELSNELALKEIKNQKDFDVLREEIKAIGQEDELLKKNLKNKPITK